MARTPTIGRPQGGGQESTALTRRAFLGYTAAAGAAAGIAPMFPPGREAQAAGRQTSERALFFNLSHEADCHTATYFLVAGGRRYRLRPVQEHPRILKRERQANRFLRGVPDSALTHFVHNVAVVADAVTISYVLKNPDSGAGTWSMSSIFFQFPPGAVLSAHQSACDCSGTGRRSLSAKRRMYGHRAARSAQDYLEEEALKDVSDHATALIALHPEVLSAEPNSAANIQKNLIATNGDTTALRIQIQQLGDAQPQQTAGHPNAAGWATLTPFTLENGTPITNTTGQNKGLIQYNAEWHPVVQQIAGRAIRDVVQQVKNCACLGADVTGALNGEGAPSLAGTIWHRRDGLPTVVQSIPAVPRDPGTIKYALVPSSPQAGYNCTATVTTSGSDVNVQLNFENWYLRWLGLWIQFQDSNGVVPISKLPPSFPRHPGDTETEAFIGILTPEFTVYGIPVQSSKATAAFRFPTEVASSAKILASGAGIGPHTFRDIEAFGTFSTLVFNVIAPPFLIAVGAAQNIDAWIKLGLIPLVQTSLIELDAFIQDLEGDLSLSNLLTIFVRAVARTGAAVLLKIVATVELEMVAGEIEDEVPIVGQIIQAIGALGAAAELAETVVEVALSPHTYEYDLTLTHDLTVTIKPDVNHNTTPTSANQYKVTALFDGGGTPRVQVVDLQQPVDEVTAHFTGVPLGGQVNVAAAFYQKFIDSTRTHILLGKASSGLVSNAVDTLDVIRIAEIKYPIGPQTTYEHKQKTVLDADGNHLWASGPGPTVKARDISCEQVPGTLCDFRGITVRQGTAQAPGYLGYAWQGYSVGVGDCISGAQGQLDQMANLGTDENPQDGYSNPACGLQPGALLAYSLLTHSSANFYLDSTSKVIRQVQLDPTSKFADPRGNQAWGKFNLESDSLLLHPTGRFVSINGANHKIETLKVPPVPMSDEDAGVHLLAQVHAGRGSRPGLISSPAAAAISADGVILVLEQDNHRIQAFDTGANPVQFFKKQTEPYFLKLTATAGGDTIYLDLAVEFTGYIYVLSYDSSANTYRLDIYHPEQSDTNPISTTMDVNAARLTVDFWRNVYTLNYEVLQVPQGVHALAEPSVSLWTPTTV